VRRQLIKRYFITGLLIWVPLGITAWVLVLIVGTMDQSLRLLPEAIHPRNMLGFDIPGAGAILTLLIIVLTGLAGGQFHRPAAGYLVGAAAGAHSGRQFDL
jgi:uncharacterized membrane protein